MFVDLDGMRVHCLTGGAAFDPARPAVVFLHGAGMDGSVWALQTRWFAHHGFAVLAPDFPGHGRSPGACLAAIETMADWVARLIAHVGVRQAAIVGHSMGSLVALATAHRHPSLVRHIVLIGTAARMTVGPELLAAAQADDPAAAAMVNLWGHGPRAGLGGAEMPGLWMTGAGQRLLAQSKAGVLFNDLSACDAFRPLAIAGEVQTTALILQGTRDLMTPLRGAQELTRALPRSRLIPVRDAGHMVMIEEAGHTLTLIADDLQRPIADWKRPIEPTATQPVGAPP